MTNVLLCQDVHSKMVVSMHECKYLDTCTLPDLTSAWKRPEWVETLHAIDVLCVIFLTNIHYYTIYSLNIDGCKKAVQSELVTEHSQRPCGLTIGLLWPQFVVESSDLLLFLCM